MSAPDNGMESIYITPEHVALREQIARFLAREVEPAMTALGRTLEYVRQRRALGGATEVMLDEVANRS